MKKYLAIILLLFMASSVPTFAQSYKYFPQIAATNGWTSGMYFTNQGLSAVTGITVSFYDDNGVAMSAQSDLGEGTSYTFNLNAGATQTINITQTSAPQGYVIVKYPNGAFVNATEVYQLKSAGAVYAKIGVSQLESLSNNYSFPVVIDNSNGLDTGIALVNPLETDQTVALTLMKSDGSIQATETMLLAAGHHYAGFLSDRFGMKSSFTGSVSISSPLGIAVLALCADNNSYGSVNLSRGPVLAPFLLSGTARSEQEPNNNRSQAQAISPSLVITGSMGSIDDEDYYSFTGKKGQIVTVTCASNMISASSRLDTFVDIYDGAGNPIAENDDSGLNKTTDSFLQMVLPEDGTYYIAVSDYAYNGGAQGYSYSLHIKLQ
jgi:hypothetical protein